jgi:hypothetical protein
MPRTGDVAAWAEDGSNPRDARRARASSAFHLGLADSPRMSRDQRLPSVVAAIAVALVIVATVAGCGGGSPSSTTNASQRTSTAASGGKAGHKPSGGQPKPGQNASASDFSAKLFGKPTQKANHYLPLKPGTQWVRQGSVNVGTRSLPHQVVTTVTDVSKTVDGVQTVAVLDQDTNGGQIAEQSIDWVAADKQGNVWYLGSYTESYEGGQFITASDAWLAGMNGAQPGILMLADPQTGTPPYSEDSVPGIEAPTAQVVKTGQSDCVPFKCYEGVVVIQEGSEFKSFAPGVGQIQTEPQASGGKHEVEKLVNLRRLTPGGLKQISDLALRLDKHARTTAPTVFGNSSPSRRGV